MLIEEISRTFRQSFNLVIGLLMSFTVTQVYADSKIDAALMQLLKIESAALPRPDQVLPKETSNGRYRVKAGDNLDGIIKRFYSDSALQHGILKAAFIKDNPKSFKRGNANWLLAGTELRLPDRDAIYKVVFKDQPKKSGFEDKSSWVKYPR